MPLTGGKAVWCHTNNGRCTIESVRKRNAHCQSTYEEASSACSHANTDGFACKHCMRSRKSLLSKVSFSDSLLFGAKSLPLPQEQGQGALRESFLRGMVESFCLSLSVQDDRWHRLRWSLPLLPFVSILIDFQELPIPTDLRDRLTFNAFGDKYLSPLPGTPGRGQGEGPSRRKLPTLTLSRQRERGQSLSLPILKSGTISYSLLQQRQSDCPSSPRIPPDAGNGL